MYFCVWMCFVYSLSHILFVAGSLNLEEIYNHSELVCCQANYSFPKLRIDYLDPNSLKRISHSSVGMNYTLNCSHENNGFYSILDGETEKIIFLAGDNDGGCSNLDYFRLEFMVLRVRHKLFPRWLFDEMLCYEMHSGNQISTCTNHSVDLENHTLPTANQSGSLSSSDSSGNECTLKLIYVVISLTIIGAVLTMILLKYWDRIKPFIQGHKEVATTKSDPSGGDVNEELMISSEVADGLNQSVSGTMSTATTGV